MKLGSYGSRETKISLPTFSSLRSPLIAALGILPLAACGDVGPTNTVVGPKAEDVLVIPTVESCIATGEFDKAQCEAIFIDAKEIHKRISETRGFKSLEACEISHPICERSVVNGEDNFFPAMSGVMAEAQKGTNEDTKLSLQPLYLQADEADRRCKEAQNLKTNLPEGCQTQQASRSSSSGSSFVFINTGSGGSGGYYPTTSSYSSYNYATSSGHSVGSYTPHAQMPVTSPAIAKPSVIQAVKPIGQITATTPSLPQVAVRNVPTASAAKLGFGNIAIKGTALGTTPRMPTISAPKVSISVGS